MTVRPATPDDVPFMTELAVQRYGALIKDRGATARWFAAACTNPDLCVLRTDDVVAIAGIQRLFYDPVPELRLLYLFSGSRSVWPVMRLLRALVVWGRARGCLTFTLRNAIGGFDLGAFARRLGQTTSGQFYTVALNV